MNTTIETNEYKYNCSHCKYHTNKKGAYIQHTKTKKHAKNTATISEDISDNTINSECKNTCNCDCNHSNNETQMNDSQTEETSYYIDSSGNKYVLTKEEEKDNVMAILYKILSNICNTDEDIARTINNLCIYKKQYDNIHYILIELTKVFHDDYPTLFQPVMENKYDIARKALSNIIDIHNPEYHNFMEYFIHNMVKMDINLDILSEPPS